MELVVWLLIFFPHVRILFLLFKNERVLLQIWRRFAFVNNGVTAVQNGATIVQNEATTLQKWGNYSAKWGKCSAKWDNYSTK